ISRHQKFKCFALMLLASLFCLTSTVAALAPAPVDYLVPPPIPPPGSVVTRFKQSRPQSILPAESRSVPQFVNSASLPKTPEQHPGLMTRVARWFGFTNQNNAAAIDQQLVGDTKNQAYYYGQPQQQYGSGDKEGCGLCNKYPWVPMMHNSIHYPVQAGNQWDAAKQNLPQQQQSSQIVNSYGNPITGQQLPQIQHAASSIVKQRAVKFNFPFPYVPPNANKVPEGPNHIQYSTGPFLPIPIPPLLSNSALPPMYNAQNFLAPQTYSTPHTVQQLPSTEPGRFAENVAQHSEIHADTAVPTQIPPTIPNNDASFEIVKSHQLVDYISSVEYPASYVPSHSFEISTQVPRFLAANHQPDPQISTSQYQHSTLRPDLSQHVPASQILTDPGSFVAANNEQQPVQPVQQTVIYEQTTNYNPPQYLEHVQHFEYDNFVSASQQNSSVVEHHQQPQINSNLDTWTLESNDYVFATSTPEGFSTTEETTTYAPAYESTTQAIPQQQQQQEDNEVEFVASIQTSAQQSTKLWPQKPKQRETPKRLLDSPIQHINGNLGAPRPFTRDPSELTFRLNAKNHKFNESPAQLLWKPQNVTPETPTPTSTYSSIDASGQYAGMSPPSLPSTYNNNELLLPYLHAKNRPRPFETTRINMVTMSPSTAGFSTWSQGQSVELHTPQESMLVRSHIKPEATTPTTTTTPKQRPTKYLTKILASNLRELLQREHEPTKLKLRPNSLDIDINKLQKNIDDWTEQEYTSLSHRPSTPTIRGRSKHIPSEYLPTTAVTEKPVRQSKTTKGFIDETELPSSINNLEPLYERESTKRFQYTHITDNHLSDFYTNFESVKTKPSPQYRTTTPPATSSTPTSTTTTPTATTQATTTTTSAKPIYLRPIPIDEPEELWKKAKVSISPKTQEKVYVVTPQPRFFPQRFYTPAEASSTTTTTTTQRPYSSFGSGFKSPRFLVRPTPGNAHKLSKISDTESKETSKESNQSKGYFTPEWFGLKGLSAYVPAQPVEIIDGNSKVNHNLKLNA
ncbi:hypothetical protein DOY81_005806, partial [Sarcophaga bullata]